MRRKESLKYCDDVWFNELVNRKKVVQNAEKNLQDAGVRISGRHTLSNLKHLAQDNDILIAAIVNN
jgi:hypothetical protein